MHDTFGVVEWFTTNGVNGPSTGGWVLVRSFVSNDRDEDRYAFDTLAEAEAKVADLNKIVRIAEVLDDGTHINARYAA